ncbi:MAG: InlB B-repeat-containing protein [Clostridia bacterium]|nr:InlB B-repeat-containing protein [Clostridia bacterium]
MKRMKKAWLSAALACMLGATSLFLLACSKETVVTYTFDSNGGTEYSQVEVEEGKEFVLPIPEREGYRFKGWYANADFSGEAIEKVVAGENATYYALWAQLFEVELLTDGGTLSQTSVYLEAGENVCDAMQAYKPTKGDLTFGDWFYNGKELSKQSALKMPNEKITLTAKYKAEYTVTLMVENIGEGEDPYVESEDEIKGLAYVGEVIDFDSLEMDVDLSVYNAVANHADNVLSVTVDADKTKNELVRYFDRKVFTVSFNPNYPDGTQGSAYTVQLKYGEGMNVPVDYTAEGYVLAGWARSSSSTEAEFEANYIETALYNRAEDAKEYVSQWIEPKRSMPLYAVWIKGCLDMFGGSDYIYLLDEKAEQLYLGRGDKYFVGEYYNDDQTFTFFWENSAGEPEMLEGKVLGNGTFAYKDGTRANWSGVLYENNGIVQSTTLGLDLYNGFSFSAAGEKVSNGTYVINRDGSYLATFTDGPRAGQEMTMLLGTSGSDKVFRIRNEEEYKIGKLVRYYVDSNNRLQYEESDYDLTLSGFGVAYYNASGSYQGFNYTREGDVISLIYNNSVVALAYMMDDLGVNGYMIYTEKYDQDFELATGGTLSIDGLGRAKYVNGTTTAEGYYTTENSLLADSILTFTASGKTYKFLITANTVEVDDTSEGAEEGAKVEITTYSAEEKLSEYKEYYYMDSESIWYAPLLVLNDSVKGEATVYGRTKEGKFVPMFRGEYSQIGKLADSDLYTFTWREDCEGGEGVFTDPFDLTKIQSFTFVLDNTMTRYNIHYWLGATEEGGQPIDYDVVYKAAEGDATLTLVAGVAIYDLNGTFDVGLYSRSENSNLLKIEAPNGAIYLEMNDDAKTFIKLDHAPYEAYLLNIDGTASATEFFAFDGKGGATYNVVTMNGEDKVVTPTEGTLVKTENTSLSGYYVYTFTTANGEMKFIQIATSSAMYVSLYSSTYNGEYNASGNTLTLDGYNTYAKYVDGDSNVYEGMYVIPEENVVQFIHDDGTFYFDLKTGKSFTVRGSEYGTYIFYDNQSWNGVYLEFNGYIVDGKGELTAFVMKEVADGKKEKVVIGRGWYAIDGTSIQIYYEDEEYDNHPVAKTGVRGYISDGTNLYTTFIVDRENIEKLYINEDDWSILSLDSIGNAVMYNGKGVREYGSYTVVTENLLYYVDNAGKNPCLYYYDVENGTIEPVPLKRKGYYTEKLDSLLFAEYGVALFNGTDRYYYEYDEFDNIILYRQDARNPIANEYGFVVDDTFGQLKDTVSYNGAKYYLNLGWDIVFNRDSNGENDYPVKVSETEAFPLRTLQFLPTGDSDSFIVAGEVTINGVIYTQSNSGCYVVREVDENGNASMYVMVGNFRFDIEVSYKGVDENNTPLSTYKVTGMRYVISAPSYGYLQTLYMYYFIDSFLGTSYASSLTNDLGTIEIVTEYSKEGSNDDAPVDYIDAEFGKAWNMVDVNGNAFTFERMEYTYDEVSDIYTITIHAEDSYTYHVHFVVEYYEPLDTFGFIMLGFTREQTLPSVTVGSDTYDITLERIITSDMGSAGSLYAITLKKNGTQIVISESFTVDGKLYCVARTGTTTTYYLLTLHELTDGTVEDTEDTENTDKKVLPYDTFSVSEEVVQTKYTEDGKSFVDIASWGVALISYEDAKYAVSKCTATENGYFVETSVGVCFQITVSGNTVVIEEAEKTE